jgi:RHS repeat-associated protein
MQQFGRKPLLSTQIDDLQYEYLSGSNRLKRVTDTYNDPNSKLGDFKYASKGAQDYTYDGNGNMNADANKNISSIQYNYLNLPAVITVTGKGTISYVYDAAGNKIQKTVAESGQPTKTTLYLGGAVYENDVMQFTGHEEGRIRFSPAAGAQPNALYYDYMLKDHLGNVRMVLTEEVQTNAYPVASMEPAQEANEGQYYTNINSTIRSTKPANYPADSYTSPNQYAAKLRGDAGTTKIGPAIILKVMAGDKFNLRVNSWWSYGAGGSLSAPNPLTELASVLANGIAGASGGKVTAIDLNNSGLTGTAATSFLSTQNGALTTRPRAFVNWVLLDENFNIAKDSAGGYIRDGYSNFQQVGDADAFTTHSLVNAPINKNGYLYIYVSNQSPNMDVYFDNLQVTHIKGPILEENHYSPWGMTLAALSSKALSGAAENKFKYNGKEEQKKEFIDGSGLDWLDFGARMYDAQIGRFFTQDRYAEKYLSLTSYQYGANNSIKFIDVNGDSLYLITYVKGNKKGDEFFKSAALTRKSDIERSNGFDAKRDKVVLLEVEDMGSLKEKVESAIDQYSQKYGKTAEFGLFSHSGLTDGPAGSVTSTKNPIDFLQMGLSGWSEINFNWSNNGEGARANFYGCNTGYADGKGVPVSWTTKVSALKNFTNVDIVGQTSSTYPSGYSNYRSHSNHMKTEKYLINEANGQVHFYRTYQVGGVQHAIGSDRNVVTPVRHSTNGKGRIGGELPGDKKN